MTTPSTIRTLVLPSERKKEVEFDSIRLRIASPDEIRSWSYGEVTKPETINYRSQKPERDGLFCQKIFGPVKDWECACGKYKKIRYKGIICDRCGVEITRSLVRRERMGHISLAVPVTHIWFLRGVPSKIGLLLGMSIQQMEKVVYFANFIITGVREDLKEKALKDLEKEFKAKKTKIKKTLEPTSSEAKNALEELSSGYNKTRAEILSLKVKTLISEQEFRDLSLRYGHLFEAGIGAEAILVLLKDLNLGKLASLLEKEKAHTRNPAKQKQLTKRIKLIRNLIANRIKPEWMVLRIIPVIPPDLRPLVQLDGGRFASSDLNDLYRRVINRNNRLKRLYELHAPEVILRNEKRMLQEAVDALLDNEMRSGKTTIASTGQRRPLKSLADILKGKQGRFRQNLLGKRVDYSGRSVIVVGPHLKLHQCGLPKIMARELFKPFIASRLIKKGIVHNVRTANRLIEQGTDEIWEILEEITRDSYVLLNRAPTLHRLSVQAFQPVLIEGKAIQIHPLVCAAFNADFDGDQMAVHIPITKRAQKEAAEIMLSSKNLLKPATGDPVIHFRQDMVWGAYWMTFIKEDETRPARKLKIFAESHEAIMAYMSGKIGLQEKIKVRKTQGFQVLSVGRILFGAILPRGYYEMDKIIDSEVLKTIVTDLIEKEGPEKTVELLDKIKELTLAYLTSSGMSWGMDDLVTPPEKKEIVNRAEKEIDKIQSQYEQGLLTEDERYSKSVEIWLKTRDVIAQLCRKTMPRFNSVLAMVESGARGSWAQLTQMLGMRGIVSSPTGRLIELPIKSSFKEGFNVLEFFISTHGSRKGVSDTALRTASAGYLTRRMVDVCQDITVIQEDCGDKVGIRMTRQENKDMGESWTKCLTGRVAARDIRKRGTKKILVKKGQIITHEKAKEIDRINPEEVFIRSVLTCQSRRGVCAKCYGYDLAYNKLVKLGTPVGIIAAQSIGEPGTQLTLRTFHTGGVAGRDITQGLPRVEELLEARSPKRKAILAWHDGICHLLEEEGRKSIKINYIAPGYESYNLSKGKWELLVKSGQRVKENTVLARRAKEKIRSRHGGKVEIEKNSLKVVFSSQDSEIYDATGYDIWVKDKVQVVKGQQLTDGSLDIHELYELWDRRAVEKYILKEIQYIYSSQGQNLNDKHLELVIKQMFSRVKIIDSGDTDLLPGAVVPDFYLEERNEKVKKMGRRPAEVESLLLGITKVSLSTDSWLSAASFQETSRILINAAVTGGPDRLRGLKENVIVGRLIPVGTGYKKS